MAADETIDAMEAEYADETTYRLPRTVIEIGADETGAHKVGSYNHLLAQEMVRGVIEAHNDAIEQAGEGDLSRTDVDGMVSVTQAQAIADEVVARLLRAPGGDTMDDVWNAYVDEKSADPRQAAFFERLRITPTFPQRPSGASFESYVTDELNDALDVDIERGASWKDMAARFPDGEVEIDVHGRGFIPLSPYDGAFRDRRVFYELGSSPAAVRVSDVALAAGEPGETLDVSSVLDEAAGGPSPIDRVSVMRGRGDAAREITYRDADGNERPAPFFDGELDAGAVYGLSAIRRFVSSDDYDDICRAVAASPSFGPARRDNLRAQARNAAAVLSYMEDAGLEIGAVNADARHHSVEVAFGRNKQVMRLIDVDNPLYACNRISLGSAWGRDQNMYMTFQHESLGAVSTNMYAFTTTPELAISLVKASQGEAVERYDDVVAATDVAGTLRSPDGRFLRTFADVRRLGLDAGLVPQDTSRVSSGYLGEAAPDGSWSRVTRHRGHAGDKRNGPLPLVYYGGDRNKSKKVSAFAVGPMDATGVSAIDNADTDAAAEWRAAVSRFSSSNNSIYGASKADFDDSVYARNEDKPSQMMLFVLKETDVASPSVGDNAYKARAQLVEWVASARREYAREVGLVSGFEAREGDEPDARRTLLDWARTREADETQPAGFALSGNQRIAALQQSYMDVICGRTDTLEAPIEGFADFVRGEGESVEDFLIRHHAAVIDAEIGTFDAHEVVRPDGRAHRERFCPDRVAEHMVDEREVSNVFANRDKIVDRMRCLNEYGDADDFIDADELAGSSSGNAATVRRLVRFGEGGPETVHDMAVLADARERQGRPFMRHMYDEVVGSLRRCGMRPDSIDVKIDDAGVIRWAAQRHDATRNREWADATGELGQVFEPDETGMVRTRFKQASFDDEANYSFVPGYVARVARQRPGERKTMEERTVLTGYEQTMAAAIRSTIAADVMSTPPSKSQVVSCGVPYSLNGAYSALYDERYPIDAKSYFMEQGMDESLFDDIVRMQASRVRYVGDFADGATAMAAYRAQKGYEAGWYDPANDLDDDLFRRVGCKNVAVLTRACRGIFDETATTMTSANQGSVRYLAQGAQVRADGTVEAYAGDDEAMYKAPLMANPLMRYSDFNPADRNCMTLSNLLQCHAVVGARVAQGFCYGLNFDDGLVVSRDFAEAHAIYPEHGPRELRGLVKGDKLSDMHGNKGVIAAVVDPAWTDEECEAHGVPTGARDLFRDNAGKLDIVQASTSLPSRHNGGQASELVDGEKFALTQPDGTVVPAAISTGSFIITNKDADAKTSVYDDEAVAAGRGRKASAQWAWVLDAKDCQLAKREIYGPSADSATRLREYLLVCGMDMRADGTLLTQSPDAVDEMGADYTERNIVSVPSAFGPERDELFSATVADGLKPKRGNEFKRALSGVFEHEGGFIELPFSLTMASGDVTLDAQLVDGRHFDGSSSLTNENHNIALVPAQSAPVGRIERRRYRLPLMAPALRCGQEYVDGVQHSHDFTRRYEAIMQAAATYSAKQYVWASLHEYYALVDAGETPDAAKMAELGLDSSSLMAHIDNSVNRGAKGAQARDFEVDGRVFDADKARDMLLRDRGGIDSYYASLESEMDAQQRRAQGAYDAMASQIKTRYLDGGKHNIFRDNVLARRMRDSATAIWSANPLLDLDEVSIGREMADTIRIADGDDVLMWRDPVLRTSGVRVMRARVVDDQTGIAINPAMDKCFDGDFDGDTIGVVSMANFSPAARAELVDAFSAATTILDKGHLHDPDGDTPCKDRPRGDYDLNVNDGLDIARYIKQTPGAAERYEAIRVRANELMRDFDEARAAFASNRGRDAAAALRDARQALAEEVIRPLSDFTHDAFEASGGGFLRYADKADYAESVYESCIKSGAKGNDKKFDGAMPFVGIDARADGHGGVSFFDASGNELDRADAALAVSDGPFGGDGQARYDHDIEAKTAGCTKTSGTPLAGSFSIRLMSALREMEPTPEAALELTYPVTQGTLQVKHNAEQAAEVFDMLSDSLRKHWRGCLLDSSGKQVKDKQGNFMQATPEQWAQQFERLYGPKGLDVDYNPEAVEQVAAAMQKMVAEMDVAAEPGVIPDLEQASPATLADKLAYAKQGSGFEVLVEAARGRADLFAGKRTQSLRPVAVRCAVYEREHAGERSERIAQLEGIRDSGVSDAVYMAYQDEIDKLEAEAESIGRKATLAAKATLGGKAYVKKAAPRPAHAAAPERLSAPTAAPATETRSISSFLAMPYERQQRMSVEDARWVVSQLNVVDEDTLTGEQWDLKSAASSIVQRTDRKAQQAAEASSRSATSTIDFSRPAMKPQASAQPVAKQTHRVVVPSAPTAAPATETRSISSFLAMPYERQQRMSVEDARWVVSQLNVVDEDTLTGEQWDLKSAASSIVMRDMRAARKAPKSLNGDFGDGGGMGGGAVAAIDFSKPAPARPDADKARRLRSEQPAPTSVAVLQGGQESVSNRQTPADE